MSYRFPTRFRACRTHFPSRSTHGASHVEELPHPEIGRKVSDRRLARWRGVGMPRPPSGGSGLEICIRLLPLTAAALPGPRDNTDDVSTTTECNTVSAKFSAGFAPDVSCSSATAWLARSPGHIHKSSRNHPHTEAQLTNADPRGRSPTHARQPDLQVLYPRSASGTSTLE